MEPSEIVKQALAKVLDKIAAQNTLERAGRFAIALINKRVAAGIELSGNPFREYSSGYLNFKFGSVGGLTGKFQRAKSHTGRMRAANALSIRSSGKVDLQLTGDMMRDLNSNVSRNPLIAAYEIEIGYITGKADPTSINKARWHNVTGAGRGRVLRRFVGLTDDERRQVFDWFRNRL